MIDTDEFYRRSCELGFVKLEAVARNIVWTAHTDWGDLEITINLSGLERIRRDAVTTRESLLTEEEIEDIEEEIPPAAEDETSDLPLDAVQIQIVRTLLEGRDATEIIRTHHLMPSVVAYAINEALFDEIGDTVLLCEGDALALVEDYAEEIEHYLGGTNNG